MTSINPAVREMVQVLVDTRKARGFKKRDVAQVCNVPVSVLTHIEKGEVDPTVSFLLAYADAIDMGLQWALSGRPHTWPQEE